MSTVHYERYINGEHEAVWSDLQLLGRRVRDDPTFEDARAVARETMRRSLRNLQLIDDRLQRIDYEFATPEPHVVESTDSDTQEIDNIESKHGPMAISVRAWYETFRYVDFRPRWGAFDKPGKLQVLYSEFYIQDIKSAANDLVLEEGDWPPDQFVIPTGGSASNCDPMVFVLPTYAADQWFFNDGMGDTYFVEYLRFLFKWGGSGMFQFHFQRQEEIPPSVRLPDKELYYYLTENLLPI